jgi:hypothetical protein
MPIAIAPAHHPLAFVARGKQNVSDDTRKLHRLNVDLAQGDAQLPAEYGE